MSPDIGSSSSKEIVEKVRRELHAAIAMNALLPSFLSQPSLTQESIETIARDAYRIADAMVAKGGPLE